MALSKIQGNEDTEWKFAKTELILTYFNAHDKGCSLLKRLWLHIRSHFANYTRYPSTDSLPAPFNLIPSPKVFQKKTSDEFNRGSEVDEEYLKTINKLVMRYRKAQKVQKSKGFLSSDFVETYLRSRILNILVKDFNLQHQKPLVQHDHILKKLV